jgi:hypothetical protein
MHHMQIALVLHIQETLLHRIQIAFISFSLQITLTVTLDLTLIY